MVKDKIPDYYDTLIRALVDEYGDNFSHTRKYENSPSSFPHLYFKVISSSDIALAQNGEIYGRSYGVEINVYHNEGVSEAEEFAETVRRIMTSTQYDIRMNCKYFDQVDNPADSSIVRYILRFQGKTTEKE